MKHIILKFGLLCLTAVALFSCEPRIEFDEGQWGDTAFLLDVQVFELEIDEDRIVAEGTVQAARRVLISNGSTIDDVNFTATVSLISGATLNEAGLIFFHQAQRIEPLNGAPIAGVAADLTGGPYVYKVHSADGTTHDWTITLVTN